MKKRYAIFLLSLLAFVMILSACGGTSGPGSPGNTGDSKASTGPAVYHKITAAQAKAMMDDGKPFKLVDVRTQDEYDGGHIKGAVVIPYNEIGPRAPTELPYKTARILVYCLSGNRSSAAAHTLVSLGYTAVYDMGGISDWPYGMVND
ncbi:MAG: rhodanese-like domain-containing protein [Clostridiales bacterium]|nr:rhodanese-like domain-containing protein [Clostridiales bacterium]